MTREEKEVIREKIKKELSALEKSIITITELLDSEVQSDANDWFTTKESNPSKEINEMALEKTRKRIILLREVLNRIESNDYGTCTVCGKAIPFERMRALPAASRCLACS